jgi:hypothetical protein
LARFGFVGGSYTAQSVNADAQTCMNWYPELDGSGAGKSAAVLYPTPGLALFYALGSAPCRGIVTISPAGAATSYGRTFTVIGTSVIELFSGQTSTVRGTITSDGLPVSMVAGANYLMIASAGILYSFNTQTNVFAAVATGGINQLPAVPISQVAYCDGFFIALQANSNAWYVSNPLDPTTWPFASLVSVFIDNVISMTVDHREVWMWGPKQIVVYYDSGGALFPFDVVPGGFLELGLVAEFSPAKLDNSIFWLGSDDRGNGMVWRAQGYSPLRVSNHAIEGAIQGYSRIDDAVGYAYQDHGHSFYVLSFPTAQHTWVYDVATGMWHERGFWNESAGVFTAHRAQYHTFNFGKHLVGDPTIGNIYQMSITYLSDFGNNIRRVRRAPHIATEQEWLYHTRLQVDLETGLGFGQLPPQFVVLDDSGGHSWQLSVNDSGEIITTSVAPSTAQLVFLNDPSNAASWQIKVLTNGQLTSTSVAFNATYPQTLPVTSPTGLTAWNIGVTLAGLLTTVQHNTVISNPSGNPQAMLRWSNDGGHTWSNIYEVSAGQVGQYTQRVIWRRLGRARDRVYELSVSDVTPWRVIDAYLEAQPGFQKQERLVSQIRKVS